MSKITIQIDEDLKKWARNYAEDSLAFENMSAVIKFAIRYVKKNPGVLPE